ncbi:glycosyltransferase [Actinomadura madurae]|uniref:glycosyltransferase family 2 protein n=1 Tax=Actinomadura madurae TaxID=1993 RepID=UPI0020D215D9|nr:glycosyltransferase family 2 protein [Actinomadura madurae]MCP9969377.1 glycosyltransferase [Actinomadura madurae]
MTTVSLIVPCYNAAKTLRPCLEAVLAQTRRPDEIVVVDDASGDGSAAIAAAQGCRVVRLPENRGVSAARNAGVAATTGDVVFFLDSDVALRPDAVENALRVLDDDPERGCVQGVYEPEPLIDDGPAEWYRILHAAYWRRRHLGDVTGVVFALAAIRRDVLRAVGPFDETLRDCEDVEYGGGSRAPAASSSPTPSAGTTTTRAGSCRSSPSSGAGPSRSSPSRSPRPGGAAGSRSTPTAPPASSPAPSRWRPSRPACCTRRCSRCRSPCWPASPPPIRGCCASSTGAGAPRSPPTS